MGVRKNIPLILSGCFASSDLALGPLFYRAFFFVCNSQHLCQHFEIRFWAPSSTGPGIK